MAEKKKARETKAYKPKKSCPKCGPSVHLAEHSNRLTCGRCGYTEMKGK
jgi:small subunit ribosomal protein S27Ae